MSSFDFIAEIKDAATMNDVNQSVKANVAREMEKQMKEKKSRVCRSTIRSSSIHCHISVGWWIEGCVHRSAE